jgi:putative endonuclease
LKSRIYKERLALGAEGELRAAQYLVRTGYRIEERNVRAGGVELDIVARRGSLVVFIEVKTRRSMRLGSPELAVDAHKQARISRGAAAWLREHGRGVRRARFDVIGWLVTGTGEERRWRMRHTEDAFDASG